MQKNPKANLLGLSIPRFNCYVDFVGTPPPGYMSDDGDTNDMGVGCLSEDGEGSEGPDAADEEAAGVVILVLAPPLLLLLGCLELRKQV